MTSSLLIARGLKRGDARQVQPHLKTHVAPTLRKLMPNLGYTTKPNNAYLT